MLLRVFSLLLFTASLLAQEPAPISLPKPETNGGKPLMQALGLRQSEHTAYSAEKLPPQVLSNLLWAAYGVNRADGMRTAPSAGNAQTIDIYVAMAEGVYRYDPKEHRLDPVAAGDVRPIASKRPVDAPVDILYVGDTAKVKGQEEAKVQYTWAETGFVAQNVYLFCASQGLATVVRAGIDRANLAPLLKLRPEQRITLEQPVGYPKK
jgi:SagB-type dehydrogenase family enzyme